VLPHSSGKRIAGLDHLRALAILLVFVFHYRLSGNPPYTQFFAEFGWTGVDLFFVLSGYLIGGQLLGGIARASLHSSGASPGSTLPRSAPSPISFRDFWIKRFFRIIPVYLVVLLLYFTIPAFTERGHLPPLWKFLTFTQNFGLDLRTGSTFSHAWSLCIEEQFYLLLPLVVMALIKWKGWKNAGWLLAVLFILGFVIRIWSWHHFITPLSQEGREDEFGPLYFKWIYYPTYNRLDGLLFGVGLAALLHFRPLIWQRLTRYGNGLLLASLVLLAAAYFLCRDMYTFQAAVFGFPLVSLAYAVLVLAALSPGCILCRWSSRFSGFIAAISYSLYLTHKQVIHLCHTWLGRHGLDNDNALLFWICLVLSILAAWMLRWAIERPFLRLRDRLLGKRSFRSGLS
jgi:peptidoglycan/LPS O-acetylase OafA/YrhL